MAVVTGLYCVKASRQTGTTWRTSVPDAQISDEGASTRQRAKNGILHLLKQQAVQVQLRGRGSFLCHGVEG